MRKMLSLIILALFVMSVFSTVSEAANRKSNKDLRAVADFSITKKKIEKSGTSPVSLGAYAADGSSPGYIIGRTWRDDQSHLSPGHYTGWRGNSTPQIHFSYGAQFCWGYTNPDACARWHHYNMFDPTESPTGAWVNGTVGVYIQPAPNTEGGAFTQVEVDETGHIIVVGEIMNSVAAGEAVNSIKIFWDVAPAGSPHGTFLTDTLPINQTTGDNLYYRQPRIAYQEYLGNYVTHVVSLEDVGFKGDNNQREMYYFRRVAETTGPTNIAVGATWDPPLLVTDSVWSNHYAFGVAQDDGGEVSLVWVGYWGQGGDVPIWVMQSYDAGASWNPKFNILHPDDDWAPWVECDAMVDSDGKTHVIWQGGGVDPMRIFHWTDRVAGSDGGGFTSLIDALDFNGLDDMCGRFYYNLFNAGKQMISECNGRIYATWIQAGDPDRGDSTDCADPESGLGFNGSYNADIMMSVSSSLDGSLWDARRNLTNSKSPGCDGTDALPCDHDNYPSTSRVGMNTDPAVVGATYWTNAPEAFEVRDIIAPGFPETGYYIDLQFINDIYPGIARYNDEENDEGMWTNSPIKWFRLPCVDPIIEPRVFMPPAFQHPENWVKAGESQEMEFEILNLGNSTLEVTGIEIHYTSDPGWAILNTVTMTIQAASVDYCSITLNPGLLDPAQGSAIGIEAWVVFTSNDPNNPIDSAQIRTVIADTVLSIESAVVETGHGIRLGALNNGNAANWPNTGAYMAFHDTVSGLTEDCAEEEIYVYELSPVIMYDANTYFTNEYFSFVAPDPDINLVPVPTSVKSESCSSDELNQYITGHFVTADSAIGMNKVWGAPTDDVTFIVEKWEIYSFDGETHTGVNIGEWIDQDVPSDSGVANPGTTMKDDDYIYVTGLEADSDVPCIQNNSRFYMTGMLGYYNVSELAGDPAVNHTGMSGAHVVQDDELMTNNQFDADSLWSFFGLNDFTVNNTENEDKRILLDIGTFDITTDTLVVWIVHGVLINSNVAGVEALNAEAKVWYAANREAFGACGCCGEFTGGYPGNTNSDVAGLRDLADITKLIDNVYISKLALVCPENGNVNGDNGGLVNLADITKLIDHVYISKVEVPNCI